MTKYILHGGFTRRDNELNQTFFNELVKDIPANGNLLMCFFASEDDKTDVFVELCEKIKLQTEAGISFTYADKNTFIDQIRVANAIYFHGGHTRILLSELHKYENLADLFVDKTVAGSSAGAYALAAYGTAHDEECMRKGLGLVPVRVVCHYKSEELPPTESSLTELQNISPELKLILLEDCEWKVLKV